MHVIDQLFHLLLHNEVQGGRLLCKARLAPSRAPESGSAARYKALGDRSEGRVLGGGRQSEVLRKGERNSGY